MQMQISDMMAHIQDDSVLILPDGTLDAGRVEQIVRIVAGDGFGQILLTDTNREHLDRILRDSVSDYRIFYVEGGEITCREETDV